MQMREWDAGSTFGMDPTWPRGLGQAVSLCCPFLTPDCLSGHLPSLFGSSCCRKEPPAQWLMRTIALQLTMLPAVWAGLSPAPVGTARPCGWVVWAGPAETVSLSPSDHQPPTGSPWWHLESKKESRSLGSLLRRGRSQPHCTAPAFWSCPGVLVQVSDKEPRFEGRRSRLGLLPGEAVSHAGR